MTRPYANVGEDAGVDEIPFLSLKVWASMDAEGLPCSVLAKRWPDSPQPHPGPTS